MNLFRSGGRGSSDFIILSKSIFSYDNFSEQSHNTCGQAVIATLLDHFDVPIEGLSKVEAGAADGKLHYPADAILRKVTEDFGPNWPWKNAVTTRGIIKRALTHYGIRFRERHAKLFDSSDKARVALVDSLDKNQEPVIVLLDIHRLGLGPRFVLHWALVVDHNSEGVTLATWGKTIDIPWRDFLGAWKCWFMPPRYRYYMLEITGSISEKLTRV
jgi:hypothetical protein